MSSIIPLNSAYKVQNFLSLNSFSFVVCASYKLYLSCTHWLYPLVGPCRWESHSSVCAVCCVGRVQRCGQTEEGALDHLTPGRPNEYWGGEEEGKNAYLYSNVHHHQAKSRKSHSSLFHGYIYVLHRQVYIWKVKLGYKTVSSRKIRENIQTYNRSIVTKSKDFRPERKLNKITNQQVKKGASPVLIKCTDFSHNDVAVEHAQ